MLPQRHHAANALRTVAFCAGLALLGLAACRGTKSSEPPVHLVSNMDDQKRIQAQEPGKFWPDGRGMRPPVPGTIARGELREDSHLYRGKVGGHWAKRLPMPLTAKLLARGQRRFNIYCAVCHGELGDGKGIVAGRGMKVPPADYHQDRLRAMPLGEFFDIISNGVRNMPPLRAQIPVADRWAIAAYVRALQRSRHARLSDVPPDVAAAKRWRQP